MAVTQIHTASLTLVEKALAGVRAEIAGADAELRAAMSTEWLARLDDPRVDLWTLGFAIVSRATGAVVGSCGFKGPPDANGIVEIAYGVAPDHRGRGYATEAAAALVEFAFEDDRVRLVCAHTALEANASTRVLTKCGFLPAGQVIDPEDGPVWRWEVPRAPLER
jgi:RimJ/RimL family protein N-acetyltransferase